MTSQEIIDKEYKLSAKRQNLLRVQVISQETKLIKITNDQSGDRIDKDYKRSVRRQLIKSTNDQSGDN